ncbi:helix-turn-helix domain-containing protein [Azoarcus communis]|uniref:Shikimate kinase n=1 Tax=Parazoarcus communis SWub3 = DSM 12120 TaxID=1121029 RepID=A0A323V947_9RHOO|nr:helix-turn-helix transcriptional regulator [Parazoarcus communis]NMG46506.1 helix-turn-helix domain-containing protein [Parazoarcus communis]NMG68855.1 helix-turn-helix domain-containing protein [Parazoarcus communis SWub3 = DSM 12120]PZA16738.1 transcriptional regulator [Azoarcus communis] [Parazoarcus communis SWub3 = DSM 12120]
MNTRTDIANTESTDQEARHTDERGDGEFLAALGKRVREIRDRRGMTRKLVAREAAVSERHLAHLEAGEGNVSIVLLRHISRALDVSLIELLAPEAEDTVEKRLIRRFLERLPQHRLEEVVFRLMRDFGHEEAVRRKRIALIGLRGAGKSTLGSRLASEMGVPFIELDREIERETGMPARELFALYGQAGYRRIEHRTLERLCREQDKGVISVGGGAVSQPETYDLLLSNCLTVWIKAQPEEHMARVLAQGDLRPMAGNDEAMEDLKRILQARESLYAKADTVVDTSGETVDESFMKLRQLVMS